MRDRFKNNKLFQTSHIAILVADTVFFLMLLLAVFTSGWELWTILVLLVGVVAAWVLHIRQNLPENIRIWAYSTLLLAEFFFYGVHKSSLFEMALIWVSMIMLFTMTCIKGLIRISTLIYYVVIIYDLIFMDAIDEGDTYRTVSRIVTHIVIVTLICFFSQTIISKWDEILEDTDEEITKLVATTKRLDDFLANASHEVRTPVNAVIGVTSVILDRDIDERTRKDLISVRQAGRRVAEQMSDILDYTETDRGKLTAVPVNYMISSLVNDVISSIRPYMKPEVEFIVDVDASIPSVLYADVAKLKKVIWHLVINGIKYTHEGAVNLKITSQKKEYGINLCIDVSDTGIGMNEAEVARIFDRFYQADSSRTRSGGGLGLGMMIVSGFVDAMGGFVNIESVPGTGTTVHVCIPQKVVDYSECITLNDKEKISLGAFFAFNKYKVPQVREFYSDLIRNVVKSMGVQIHGVDSVENLKKVVDSVYLSHVFVGMKEYEMDPEYIESIAERIPVFLTADSGYELPKTSHLRFIEKPLNCFSIIAAVNTGAADAMRGMRLMCRDVKVLVVDDEPMNLIVANGIFSGYGMKVDTAESGRESIEKCALNKYDIVFMDHMMPEMDGVEAMKHIRADVRGKERPKFVALTANTVSTAVEMFRMEGFDGFVGKPIEKIELERVLKFILPEDKLTYVRESVKTDSPEGIGATFMYSSSAAESSYKGIYGSSQSVPESVPSETSVTPDTEKTSVTGLDDLLELGVDVAAGLEYCDNDEELYMELLGDYADAADENVPFMREKIDSNELSDYEIKIHSVKSTSRLIGAMELGDMAEELEHAANAKDMDFIISHHEAAMEEYMMLTAAIKEVTDGI